MKPPFAYYGGKARLAPWIASLLPPHRIYVEPFAGSAAVLFAKKPAVHEVINDVNGDIVTFFRMLRDHPEDLARACSLTPYARDEFAAAELDCPLSDLERARRWWVVVNQGFNKSGRARNGWSSSVECQNGEAKTVQNRIAHLTAVAHRLGSVTIDNRDAVDIIAMYGKPKTPSSTSTRPTSCPPGSTAPVTPSSSATGRATTASPALSTTRPPRSCCRATRRRSTTTSTATGTAPSASSCGAAATGRRAICRSRQRSSGRTGRSLTAASSLESGRDPVDERRRSHG
jgi:hypothetical protein